jgi:hypothetical protein
MKANILRLSDAPSEINDLSLYASTITPKAHHLVNIFKKDEVDPSKQFNKKGPADILIVDDNTFNVYSLKLLIEEAFQMPCDSAYSAKEAL